MATVKLQALGANFAAKDGKTAYEVAVDNGFEGTEQEWVESLKGEKGDTPYIGENGNWWIAGEDTGKPSQNEGALTENKAKDLFVDKATVKVGTERLYGVAANTLQTKIWELNSGYAKKNSIPYRGSTGHFVIEEPTKSNHPASKNYVDGADIALSERIDIMSGEIDEVSAIAKQANFAKGFDNYQALIAELNNAPYEKWTVGQSFLIVTLNVPDLWVSDIEDVAVPYTYVDDESIISELQTNGVIQFGYYKLSMLETLKQDLTNYMQKPKSAVNMLRVVTIEANSVDNSTITSTISPNAHAIPRRDGSKTFEVGEPSKDSHPATKGYVDNNFVKSTDIGNGTRAGVFKYLPNGFGLQLVRDNATLAIYRALRADIDNKTDEYKPIVPITLDYAVKKALSDYKASVAWTDEEKASARELLGVASSQDIDDIRATLDDITAKLNSLIGNGTV